MNQTDDSAALISRVVAGDMEAWEELARQYSDPAYSLALRILGNTHDAQDAVQETFLRVRKYAKSFRYGSNVKSWITKIACREALRIARRRSRKQSREVSYEQIESFTDLEEEKTVSQKIERTEIHELLRKAIDGLPTKLKSAIVLSFGAGMKQVEIARELGCDQSAISYRVQQGLDSLRSRLKAVGVSEAAALTPILIAESMIHEQMPTAFKEQLLGQIRNAPPPAALRVPAMTVAAKKIALVTAGVLVAAGIGGVWLAENKSPTQADKTEAAPFSADAGWHPMPTEPRQFYIKPGTPPVVSRSGTHWTYHAQKDPQWKIRSLLTGAEVTHEEPYLDGISYARLGKLEPLAREWAGFVDYSESATNGWMGLTVIVGDKSGRNQCWAVLPCPVKGMGKFFHVTAWPEEDGVHVVFRRSNVRVPLGAWDVADKLRPDEFRLRAAVNPSPDRTFTIGFMASTKVTFRQVRVREHPEGWKPDKNLLASQK